MARTGSSWRFATYAALALIGLALLVYVIGYLNMRHWQDADSVRYGTTVISQLDQQGQRMLIYVDAVIDPEQPDEPLLFFADLSPEEQEARSFWPRMFGPLEWIERNTGLAGAR